MKTSSTMFTSLFVLLASFSSLQAAFAQFPSMPECGVACVRDVAQDKNCADVSCLCAEQSSIITCIYRTCPVEDRAGSAFTVRSECSDASPPATGPASSSSSSAASSPASSAAASSSSSGAAPETTADDASPTDTPATTGTPTTASGTHATPAPVTRPATRNVASPVESSSSRLVRSSASRASTVVVLQTIGATDETGLGGSASSVRAGVMGYVVAFFAMGAGALLL
ncbi:hypothetical protein BKA70DRAFT_1315206 [Coprinopsis sp. MPI-PUGE-AT-0042]|nr:hypothetical protein BKA70DRAFT_1315206 [Coprinopsis sp. MPI-PUGE-AT-0042]